MPGGVTAAALPSPKPLDAAAPSSSAIVPHQSSLTEVIGHVETKAGLAGQSLPNGCSTEAGQPARASQTAVRPRLAGARGSLRRVLALRAAGRSLCHLASDVLQVIVLALERGCTRRDDIVEFVNQRSSSIKTRCDRAAISQTLCQDKKLKSPRWRQDGDTYTLTAVEDSAGDGRGGGGGGGGGGAGKSAGKSTAGGAKPKPTKRNMSEEGNGGGGVDSGGGGALKKRPKGRAPAGKVWDGVAGEWEDGEGGEGGKGGKAGEGGGKGEEGCKVVVLDGETPSRVGTLTLSLSLTPTLSLTLTLTPTRGTIARATSWLGRTRRRRATRRTRRRATMKMATTATAYRASRAARAGCVRGAAGSAPAASSPSPTAVESALRAATWFASAGQARASSAASTASAPRSPSPLCGQKRAARPKRRSAARPPLPRPRNWRRRCRRTRRRAKFGRRRRR